MHITKKYYKISSNLDKNIKIVVLADVHYYSKKNSKKLGKVLKTVKEIIPDYICIPGDLMDCYDIFDEEIVLNWLKDLSSISKVLISIGNHEFILKNETYNHKLFDKIDSISNCYVLDNKVVTIDNIDFIGATLPDEYYSKYNGKNDNYVVECINNNIKKFKKHKYSIMIYHSPIDLYKESILNNLNIKDKLDLILCGHMHGGITPNVLKKVMKGRGFFDPNGKIGAKMCYGLYDFLGPKCIISSGVTKSSHTNKLEKLDFLFSPEVTIVNIEPKSD